MNIQQHDSVGDFLNNAQREQHDIAKSWWWVTRGLQLIVLVIGIIIGIWNMFSAVFALVAAFLSIGSVLTQWVSDNHKGNAQALHRKFEFLDALGWEVSSRELRNLHVTLPKDVKTKLDESPNSPYAYFASKSPKSPKRLMENLTETTYFSQHLAMRSARIFGFITFIVLLVALFLLLLTLQTSQTTGVIAARTFISILVFLFTAGLVRLTYEFYRFSQTSRHIEESTSILLKQQDIELEEAIKLYHEYQLARAISPLIPSFVWKSMRDELNIRWEQYKLPNTEQK